MSLFVLDTDTLTLLEEAHPIVSKKVSSVSAEELAVTVVTVEEKLTGWYTLIRRAKKPDQFIHAYHLWIATHYRNFVGYTQPSR